MAVFTGAATALITPMNADGSLNFDEMGRLIDDQIANGIDALVICGTTGEASTMSHDEHIETISFAVAIIDSSIPNFCEIANAFERPGTPINNL